MDGSITERSIAIDIAIGEGLCCKRLYICITNRFSAHILAATHFDHLVLVPLLRDTALRLFI